jgi:glycerophosphoryl diester phosphodiesterase
MYLKPFAFLAFTTLTFGSSAQQAAHAPLPALKHPIAVIAHRAGRGLRPENTLAAIKNAISLGADYVELDIRTTSDGKLVIMHDSRVDRTTNGTGEVSKLSSQEIAALDAGSKFSAKYAGEHVPTFDQVLSACKGHVNIYVDHKSAPTAQVLAAIKAHGMQKHVLVYNGPEELTEWKKLDPHVPVMPSLPDEFRKPGGISTFEKVLSAEALDGGLDGWDAELVAQAHAAGVKVYVDNLGEYDNEAGFEKAIKMGVDGIQTDYPDRLIAYLKTAYKAQH